MIVHVSCKNTNLYIPVPVTICLCLANDNDLLDKFTRLSTNLICFTSKYDPNNSQVKETLVRCAWFNLLRCSLPLYKLAFIWRCWDIWKITKTFDDINQSQPNPFTWSLMHGHDFWIVWGCGRKTSLYTFPRYCCSLYEKNITCLWFPLMWIREITCIHISFDVAILSNFMKQYWILRAFEVS